MRIGTSVKSPSGFFEVSVLTRETSGDLHLQQLYKRLTDGKVFVAGRAGSVYELNVRNLLSQRIEVINTVDGMNTLKEEEGDLEESLGLVFSPLSTHPFTGWRISDHETRQFVFGSPAGSVADQAVHSTENTGVIGFAAYREVSRVSRRGRAHGMTLGACATSDVAVAAAAAGPGGMSSAAEAPANSLGTHMGEKQEDYVGRTTFIRSGPPDVLVIGYDTEEALRDIMGAPEPNPFPRGSTGYSKYAMTTE